MFVLLLACSERFVVVDTADSGAPIVREDTDTPDTGDTGPIDTDTDTGPLRDEPLELCINEFMPDNESSTHDETLAYVDWIELHNPGDAPVQLDGWSITDFRLEPEQHVLGGGLAIPPGGYLVLWADGLPDTGPDHLSFKLGGDGGEVALYAPDGRGSIVTYGPMAADFSLARVPDCCEGDGCLAYDFRGSPGESNVDPVYEDVPLFPAGSTWKYWDAGTSPGVGWEAVGFDDSTWPSGAGPLGYGDTHLVTTVGYGGVDAAKHITTWFRATFDVPGAITLSSAELSLLRDDGAIVYLNGVELVRDNMPEGAVTEATLATASVGSTDEPAYWDFELDPALLVPGTNTLAVEIHQSAPTSSDLGFDLAVTAERVVVGE